MRWDSESVSRPGTAIILSAEAGALARLVVVLVGRPSRCITLPDIAICLDRSACSHIIDKRFSWGDHCAEKGLLW